MKNIYLGYSVVIKDKWGETLYTFKELKKAKEMMKQFGESERLRKKYKLKEGQEAFSVSA
jgi:hypothetical protein